MTPAPGAVLRALLAAYGEQGWWPVTAGRAASPSYRPSFRGVLSERQRAEVCIGAILTQNTSWSNVLRALARLRQAGVRDLNAIAALSTRRLASLIRSSGYFRQKARKLKEFAAHARGQGSLRRWLSRPQGPLREELLSLWGVGPETADSILLYAGGRPAFVVDAYTLRLGERLGWWRRADYARAQRLLAGALPKPSYAEFHALVVAHAKRHCRATPVCTGCPLRGGCAHARRSSTRA